MKSTSADQSTTTRESDRTTDLASELSNISLHQNSLSGVRSTGIEKQIMVNVKKLTGKVIRVNIKRDQTILDVKNWIQDFEGISPDQQRLIYGGKVLDEKKTLFEYDIHDQETIHLMLRLNGDIGIFADLQNSPQQILAYHHNQQPQFFENCLQASQINELVNKLEGDPKVGFQVKELQIEDRGKLQNLIVLADLEHNNLIRTGGSRSDIQDLKIYLPRDKLVELVGSGLVQKLQTVFPNYNTIILRRCQAYGKAIKFHTDQFSLHTMQISLTPDSAYRGGKLIYATQGKLHIPKRSIGTVTIHNNKIVHAVSQLHSGIRYGLFFLVK